MGWKAGGRPLQIWKLQYQSNYKVGLRLRQNIVSTRTSRFFSINYLSGNILKSKHHIPHLKIRATFPFQKCKTELLFAT